MPAVATADHALGARPSLPSSDGWAAEDGWWRDLFVPVSVTVPGRRARLADVAVAVAVAVVQVAGTFIYSRSDPGRWGIDAGAVALLLAGPVALLVRRRWPEVVLAVAFVAAAGYAAGGWPRGPVGFPAFGLALASAIVMGRRAFAWGVLVAAYPVFVGLPSLVPDEAEQARSLAGRTVNLTWWLPLVGAVAEWARVSAERRTDRAIVRREEARRRASHERLAIARELHDVLAHTISLINVQSGVALHLLDDRPEHARPALAAINEASEEALRGLRSALDVLTVWSGGEQEAVVPRTPTAGLGDLDDLIRRTRSAGLDIDLVIDGDLATVPAGVDLAAFRMVQESLTNVVRHAGDGAAASVRLERTPTGLVVQVEDDGDGRAAGESGGRGLAGMRERVHALGGTFAAGPLDGPPGGFRVRAELPLEQEVGP